MSSTTLGPTTKKESANNNSLYTDIISRSLSLRAWTSALGPTRAGNFGPELP